jgi:hypothetical protein
MAHLSYYLNLPPHFKWGWVNKDISLLHLENGFFKPNKYKGDVPGNELLETSPALPHRITEGLQHLKLGSI